MVGILKKGFVHADVGFNQSLRYGFQALVRR